MKNKIKYAVIIFIIGGMIMSYTRVNWQNAPSTATPVNAENLNTMDKGIADAHSQLAENETKHFYSKASDHNTRKAIMTFVDDDGRSQFYGKWKPIIEDKDIPVTCALVTSKIGGPNYLTIEQIQELKGLGVEFVSHSHDHAYLGTLTETEIRTNFESSQSFLKQHGLTHDVLVYPYGSQSVLLRQVAREYFSCGVDVINGYNLPPLSTFRIQRMSWNKSTLEEYKAVVDEVAANGGWLVWMTHSQYPEFVGDQLAWVSEIIDYARGLGVEITSVKEGLKKKGNIVDVGDIENGSSRNVAIIDSEGNAYGQNIGTSMFISHGDLLSDINGHISEFKKNCRTMVQISYSQAAGLGLPRNYASLVEVYRGITDDFGEQILHQHGTGLKYARTWDGADWSEWQLITTLKHAKTNDITADTTPGDEKLRSLSSISIVTNEGKSGFPNNSPGLLLSYTHTAVAKYPRQEYYIYGSNRKYTRYWDGTNWTNWIQLGGGYGSTALRPTGVDSGYMYFDSVLKKPIWWDGTNWVDANGTIV